MADPTPVQRPLWPRIRFYFFLAIGSWVLRSLIIAPFSIPSGSMLPTMAIGDYLFVTKWPYGYSRSASLSIFRTSGAGFSNMSRNVVMSSSSAGLDRMRIG